MMGVRTSSYKTFSKQTFTEHGQQILFNHFMCTVFQTCHDECLKNFPA